MDRRILSDSVLTLGKRLVDELGLDQSVDTLGRWMAHYIAEKIDKAETARGESYDQKLSECCDAILKLWTHRSTLPNGHRLFEDFEPIFRTMQSLDLTSTTPRYFVELLSKVDQNDEDDSTEEWLKIASNIDCTAKALIRYCLANAAREAVDKSKEWVVMAEAIKEKEEDALLVIRSIAVDVNTLDSENPDDKKKIEIENLLGKLQKFNELASTLSSVLRKQLDETDPK